jgi:hypothetical protein
MKKDVKWVMKKNELWKRRAVIVLQKFSVVEGGHSELEGNIKMNIK